MSRIYKRVHQVCVGVPEGEARVPTRLVVYVGLLAICAMGLVALLVSQGVALSAHGSAWPLVGFGLLALLAEHQSVKLSDSLEISVAFLPLLFVAVVFGPLAAALLGALTMATEFRAPLVRWLLWTSNRVLLGGAAGLAAQAAADLDKNRLTQVMLATGAAAFANFSLDLVLATATLTLRKTGQARDVLRATAPLGVAGVPLYTAIVGLIAYAYVEFSAWSAALSPRPRCALKPWTRQPPRIRARVSRPTTLRDP